MRARDFDQVLTGVPSATSADVAQHRHPDAGLTRLDVWWARVLDTRAKRLAWAWAGPIVVTLLAAVLRLWNLGSLHFLVFDETYYVKDAYSMMTLGYEGQWPAEANDSFNAGIVDVFTAKAAYIAHPPLGKWIISLGLRVFGAEDAVGWRISTAIVGVLAVALLCLIAWALFRSTALATLAGGLMAVDGLAIVMSRTALLDNSLMLFTLLGFGAILLDRRQSAGRLDLWMTKRADAARSTDWGPSLLFRPWLVAAGAAFGLASAVKWSGLYFLAAFALYVLVVDAVARRRAGVHFWASSVVFRQAPVTFLLMVPVAVGAYLASWTGWLVTAGGYDRDWASLQPGASSSGLVNALQSLWHYHVAIYNTNLSLSTPHGYQANPLSWLFLVRPTAFSYIGSERGENGCTLDHCSEFITSIANPVLWWLAVAAAFYLLFRLARRREWRVGLILAGIGAGYLPWLLYTDRTVFQFYTIVFLPYLILGLVFVVKLVLGSPADPPRQRRAALLVVGAALVAILLTSVFFWSAWTGIPVGSVYQRLHYWLPTWG
ncbi:MAG: phospholipid carrier-dependent glycosyltransferase [Burkholderiaceae bacterium]|nr:phospholipid carrier-dependent glycosyltransferase [Microbacteriaceae bacterium]